MLIYLKKDKSIIISENNITCRKGNLNHKDRGCPSIIWTDGTIEWWENGHPASRGINKPSIINGNGKKFSYYENCWREIN
jgi:hypothetical protein